MLKKQIKKKHVESLPLNSILTTIGNIQLPNYVQELFRSGPNATVLRDRTPEEEVPLIENLIMRLDPEDREHERWKYIMARNRYRQSRKYQEQWRMWLKLVATGQWLKDNNLKCTKDDKTNKFVILPNDTYDMMLKDYVNASNAER